MHGGQRSRKVIIVRHGERVDHRFQDAWVENCFDKDGNYTRQNLNQPWPENLPPRQGSPQSYIRDSPLTEIGLLQASLRGKGLKDVRILQDDFEVYSSPSLRCIQTARNILKEMNVIKELKLEPSLFEWTKIQWYLNGNMPKWMSNEELADAGFRIDSNYKPLIPKEEMKDGESMEAYYSRSHNFLAKAVKDTDKDLLVIAHGFSAEVCTRQLLGFPMRSEKEVLSIVCHVPYCGMTIMKEDPVTGVWDLLPLPAQLQILHKSAHEFCAKATFLR